MPPKFGTSGLRGLVIELSETLVKDYTHAFIDACDIGSDLFIGRDLRPSSSQLSQWVMEEALASGLTVFDCGVLPTPALALAAQGQAAIMVTGSHIPADRNGLKFYAPKGEISKSDEVKILAALGSSTLATSQGMKQHFDASALYIQRYEQAFGPTALSGLRVGVYEHSSVARDLLVELMSRLGATPISIARSDTFIPVDTEALDVETQLLFSDWIQTNKLDVLISTDGDADRPMLVDETARVVAGDVLGALTARAIDANIICTPVSSNTQVDTLFDQVIRTRIGSPYVIAAMESALTENKHGKIAGYEANGGFLLGYTATGPAGKITPLMTRDCLLPIIAPLAAAKAQDVPISALIKDLPARFTAADRLQGIPTKASADLLNKLATDAEARMDFFDISNAIQLVDHTDGLRTTFENGDIVHLRPSGNAPEFRCYTESSTATAANALLSMYLLKLKTLID